VPNSLPKVPHNPNTDIVKLHYHDVTSADITALCTVVRDGWYNAFTDLAIWKGMYWLCYRRGTGHGAGNSVEVVLRSNDLRRWREVRDFESPAGIGDGCSAADGHFCVTPDCLYLFIGTRNPTRSFVTWSDDGVKWSEPRPLRLDGDDHPYTWRVRWRDGRFYSAICHLEQGERPLDLIVSNDGVDWSSHTSIVGREELPLYSEETELHWRPDGELWCVVRAENAAMYWSCPPYTKWEGGDLGAICDAPVICESAGRTYLAGRVRLPGVVYSGYPAQLQGGAWEGQGNGTTGLYHLTKGSIELIRHFPCGGDASYPGLISTEPGKLAISFYSDIAYWTGTVKPRYFSEWRYKSTECDIYLAELNVPD